MAAAPSGDTSGLDPKALKAVPPIRVPYKIHSTSGHHSTFVPEHILTPSPPGDDQHRWTAPSPESRRIEAKRLGKDTSGSGNGRGRSPEWIQLELDEVALVRRVGFGKASKPHPCTLLSFTLWGGPSPDPLSMECLLGDGSLRNDGKEEVVGVGMGVGARGGDREEEEEGGGEVFIPIKYLRLDCHLAANANYSISIWHLFLEGYPSSYLSSLAPPPSLSLPSASPAPPPMSILPPSFPITADALLRSYTSHRTAQTTHSILAHLRRSGPAFSSAFSALLSASPPAVAGSFEHPLLTTLHEALVVKGDFNAAEEVLERAKGAGLFRLWDAAGSGEKARKGRAVAKWELLTPSPSPSLPPSSATSPTPPGRGGHSLVRIGRKLLLYGGWDGHSDLGDVWEWDLPLTSSSFAAGDRGGPWRKVEQPEGKGEGEGAEGPGKRSCHAAVADERGGWVYVLGGRRDDPADLPFSSSSAAATAAAAEPHRPSSAMEVDPSSTSSSSHPASSAANGGEKEGEKDDPWASDFWRYKATGPERGRWECLSRDTRKDGGPGLLFDHSLALLPSSSTSGGGGAKIFVFGGKNQPYDAHLDSDSDDEDPLLALNRPAHRSGSKDPTRTRYSGLWCYDIEGKRWSHLIGDPLSHSSSSPSYSDRLLSRAGSALVLDSSPARHPRGGATLYIHSGQRNESYLQDLWAVRIAPTSAEAAASAEDEEQDESREEDDEGKLWRQGAVLDLPPPPSHVRGRAAASGEPAATRSLIDLAALPASPSASPSRASATSSPTILQIRRLYPPPGASPSSPSSVPPNALPPPGFTHRLSLAPSTGEWTLLTGLVREQTAPGEGDSGGAVREGVMRGVWRRRVGKKPEEGVWEIIEEEWAVGGEGTPGGRYASQVVYDPLLGEHYMFGGSSSAECDWRLGDFWKLRVVDPSPEEALRVAKFLVRKQRFAELCRTSPTVFALSYLQTALSSVVDHSSPTESAAFRACMAAVLSAPPTHNIDVEMGDSLESLSSSVSGSGGDVGSGADEAQYKERHALFEKICAFFPKRDRQPEEDLQDAARLVRAWRATGERRG
ncbi:hypothetical protein JCM10213_008183 [Rhodosporidiobolus nylandii]